MSTRSSHVKNPSSIRREAWSIPARGRRHGFTILEILIVCAVIIIIGCMTLTAIRRVQEAARRTVCASNLRQFLVAELSYAQDWKGTMQPMFVTSNGSYFPSNFWATMMDFLVNDYGMDRLAFYCPSVAMKDTGNYWQYAGNWDMYGPHVKTDYQYFANPGKPLGAGSSMSTWADFAAVPNKTYDRPADTVVIGDLVFMPASTYTPFNNTFVSNHYSNNARRGSLWGPYQMDRKQLAGANEGRLDGSVYFKKGSEFPALLENRNLPGFNATLTHCQNWSTYNWAFFL